MAVLLQHMLCICPMHSMTLQGNKEPAMATIWYVLLGFWRLVVTPQAWRCFFRAVKTARESNRTHCPSSPGQIGVKGMSALCWVVTSFWRNDERRVGVVEKSPTEDGGFFWVTTAEGHWDPVVVDYYSCVWTPAGVIPLPWVDDWFPLADQWGPDRKEEVEEILPRRRSARSQFKN